MKDKSKIAATILYCGHNGVFLADVVQVGTACVVRASKSVYPGDLARSKEAIARADYHLRDFPKPGFWRPDIGVFVVEENQLIDLKEKK